MSLYDDFDTRERAEKVAGWSSGIKLLQSQLQLKKATTTQPRRDNLRKAAKVLAPVIDLKSRRNDDDDIYPSTSESKPKLLPIIYQEPQIISPTIPISSQLNVEYNIEIIDEYNPLLPNEYEKVAKELREVREREYERKYEERERDRERRRPHRKSRFEEPEEPAATPRSGFGGRRESEDESPPHREAPRGGGAAIAPPPSLLEPSTSSPITSSPMIEKPNYAAAPYGTSSVAAKIMAKYGFKEGQGLGKQQQGMSMALQVEKTSKRGGRIIHEKEIAMPPPMIGAVVEYDNSPPSMGPPSPIAMPPPPINAIPPKPEPTITEIMKSPSKVVLLRNMVGPGDVDNDLEPEVMEECHTKYGEVVKVMIHELPGAQPEEAVRIFVEFKRIESAIKAVVDLNGRFFGGRQVRAGFYSCLSFSNLNLLE